MAISLAPKLAKMGVWPPAIVVSNSSRWVGLMPSPTEMRLWPENGPPKGYEVLKFVNLLGLEAVINHQSLRVNPPDSEFSGGWSLPPVYEEPPQACFQRYPDCG